MIDPLYPDPAAPQRLLDELTDFLGAFPFVQSVQVFGSLATETADRWSDIDLIAITDTRDQFRLILERLRAFKIIRYHSPFTITDDPVGGCVLGIAFADEAIFHVLDLNFMTATDRQIPGVFDRFGPIQSLLDRQSNTRIANPVNDHNVTGDPKDAEEEQIYIAIHFTKKALKQVLRGNGDLEKLRQHLARLDSVLQDYPPDFTTPNGDMGYIAYTYRDLAARALALLDS